MASGLRRLATASSGLIIGLSPADKGGWPQHYPGMARFIAPNFRARRHDTTKSLSDKPGRRGLLFAHAVVVSRRDGATAVVARHMRRCMVVITP